MSEQAITGKYQAKGSKRPRAAPTQITSLIEYMARNRDFANAQFARKGKVVLGRRSQWQALSNELNALGGTHKRVEQWKTTWRDLKNNTITKFRLMNTEGMLTNKILTKVDKKILNIMGIRYIEDMPNSPGSTPEGEDEYKITEFVDRSSFDVDESSIEFKVQPETTLNMSAESFISAQNQEEPTTSRKSNRKKRRRNRLLNKFTAIAGQQSENMNMFAHAIDKIATAIQHIASATDKFAEAALLRARNEEIRIAFMSRGSTQNKETF